MFDRVMIVILLVVLPIIGHAVAAAMFGPPWLVYGIFAVLAVLKVVDAAVGPIVERARKRRDEKYFAMLRRPWREGDPR